MIAIDKTEQEKIIEQLKGDSPLTVTFTKASTGEERVMTCTLNESYLPPRDSDKQSDTSKSTTSLSVWDVNANGWRAFRWENVTNVTYPEDK